MDMFTSRVHIMASHSDGYPFSFWIFLCECTDFDSCMRRHSGDFFTIDGFYSSEDFFYKRGVRVGEIDRGFMAKLKVDFVNPVSLVNPVKCGEYFLFHWLYTSRDICTDEVAPLECAIYELHLAEVP